MNSVAIENPLGPRYRQIADALRAEITRGEYEIGTLLPTEIDICAQYEVSRHTAREALRILAEDGMVERRQGHGTRVVAATPHAFQRSISSIADLLQYGANTHLQIKSSTKIAADSAIAKLLQCEKGVHCVHLHAWRSERHAATPFCVTDIYRVAAPDAVTKRLTKLKGAVYAIIDELALGHLGRVEQHISAGRLSVDDAVALGVRPNDPCLRIVRRYFDPSGALILAALSRHRSTDYVYSMELNRNP